MKCWVTPLPTFNCATFRNGSATGPMDRQTVFKRGHSLDPQAQICTAEAKFRMDKSYRRRWWSEVERRLPLGSFATTPSVADQDVSGFPCTILPSWLRFALNLPLHFHSSIASALSERRTSIWGWFTFLGRFCEVLDNPSRLLLQLYAFNTSPSTTVDAVSQNSRRPEDIDLRYLCRVADMKYHWKINTEYILIVNLTEWRRLYNVVVNDAVERKRSWHTLRCWTEDNHKEVRTTSNPIKDRIFTNTSPERKAYLLIVCRREGLGICTRHKPLHWGATIQFCLTSRGLCSFIYVTYFCFLLEQKLPHVSKTVYIKL